MNAIKSKLLPTLIISLFTFLFIGGLYYLEKDTLNIKLLNSTENQLVNVRFFYKDLDDSLERFVSKKSIIVGIDEKSLGSIGKWPWFREVHSKYIQKIQQFDPQAVHLDVLFNLSETIPQQVNRRLKQQVQPKTINIVQNAFADLDHSFAQTLKQYDNVYIDQLLSLDKSPLLTEAAQKKFIINEKILKENSIPAENIDSRIKENIVYIHTEPLVSEFVQNAIPAVVNAVPDEDSLLRKATLIFPYLDTKSNQKYYIPSIYLLLITRYYDISLKDIKLLPKIMRLEGARAPFLNSKTKDPIIKQITLSRLKGKLNKKNFQKKYDDNFYNFIVGNFRLRYSQDELKIPEFPLLVEIMPDHSWSIFKGLEIYNAAKTLNSKKVNVIFFKRKNLDIPLVKNSRENPFALMINYASPEKETDIDINNSEGKLQETGKYKLPYESYSDVYSRPLFPKLPIIDKNGNLNSKYNIAILNNWFKKFVKNRVNLIKNTVFKQYGDVSTQTLFGYALEENPYEGSFIFYDLYLNQLGGPLDKNSYASFIKDFFKQNELPLDHPLISEFLLEKNVALDYLIEAYQQNYQKFYNKVVFTGAATLGMARDVHKTPYSDMFGISTIVNSFNTIIKENFLVHSSEKTNYLILGLLCLILSFIYIFLQNYLKYSFFVLSVLVTLVLSIWLFSEYNYVLLTSTLLFSNIIIFIGMTLYSLLGEERNKKFLHSTFSTYLSPEVIDEMYSKKELPTLGGEQRYITAYFTDIQGFSSFSEILTPTQLVELLNEYLGAMTDILLDNKGTLDKYEGDAIIAFFGAPSKLPDAAYLCCFTAIKMQEKLLELRKLWVSEKGTQYQDRNTKNKSTELWTSQDKWPKLVHNMRMRIGINSGEIVVGNMGSVKRQNYTMMGDDVNLAARLESAAKQYGVFTVASKQTLNSVCSQDGVEFVVKDRFEYRLIDRIVVMGKEEPVDVYELFGFKNEVSSEVKQLIAIFNNAQEYYFNCQWKEAIETFKKAEVLEPYLNESKTNPSRVFIEKSTQHKKKPPKLAKGKKWDGVTVLTSK